MTQILVVDDSADIRLALKTLLVDAGHEVREAVDGADVMPAMARRRPDVVLLDVAMPRQDGFETLKEMKSNESTRDVPVIMVTAKGRTEDLSMARALGARDYISKPWTDGEVELSVSWVLQSDARTRSDAGD